MSTSQTSIPASNPDPDEVARAKREIQGLIQEIAELSRTDVSHEDFYDALLNRIVAALAAAGGAVWTVADNGQLELIYQINLQQTGLPENPVGQMQHARLLHQVLPTSEGALIAPHSGHAGESDSDEDAAANPTDFLLVLGPVHNDQGPQALVEIYQRAGARPATQRGYLRFVLQACELAGDFLRGHRLRHLTDKQSLWEQLESFTRLAHEKLDTRQTAYTVANEGRRLIGCDRVSVAIQRGSRCPIEAISGQDTFDKRSNVAVMLGTLARAVTRTGEDVWYTGDTSALAPQVEKALDAYVDESNTKTMAVLPLTEPRDEEDLREDNKPPKVIGALIVEQMVDSRQSEGFTQRVDVVRSHSSTALNNALEHESLFLMPVWKALGKATSFFRGRTLPKTIGVLSLIAGVIAAGIFVPRELAMKGDARLRPVERDHVFASLSGEVREILVKNNEPVRKGDLLAVMESLDLETEIKQAESEQRQLLEKLSSAKLGRGSPRERDRSEERQRAAEAAVLNVQLESLNEKLSLLAKKSEKLNLYAPIDGQVITWELEEKLLGRTVSPGDQLMSIVDPTGDWELELFVPESRVRHVTEAYNKSDGKLEVTFILATHPADHLKGWIVEIDDEAKPHGDTGNALRLRVAFDQKELRGVVPDPKVNAGATAKVHCGKRSVGYVLLHSLIDAFKREVLFRFN